jgi:small subunit ribosomal protein S4|tara:strand:+ start:2317 stop:2958 length:642 start_codon:yes stop_codon:yes gene_type:complete
MGQTKRIRKKYTTPSHPWQKDRILEEKELTREYGLKNKKEIWKYSTKLSSARNQVKKIIANVRSEQAQKEKQELFDKLLRYSIISKDSSLDDILDLKIKDFLERRLQTIVFKKGLARSINQARQFITHGHILIEGQKITAPSYLISKDEEKKIQFLTTSTLSKEDHPERTIKEKREKEKKEKIIKKEEPKKEVKEEPKKEETPKKEVKEEIKK